MKKTEKYNLEYAESIINTIREPLIVLDHDLRVISVSRSFYKFFKVKPEETMGQLIYDLGNKQWDIPKLRELLETILPQKTTFDNYEVEHVFKTIGKRIMLLNARQIQRVLGKEQIILLAIEDITERREIEIGLEDTRKELEAFSYSVSHDLRAPLRAMSGFSNLLVEGYGKQLPPTACRYLDIIQMNTLKMGTLIDDLLKFSHMGKQDLAIKKVNCSEMVEHVLTELQTEQADREVEVVVGKLPTCQADPALLRQVYINLLSNAFKFTKGKKNAQIEVSSKIIKGKRVYFVKDNGVGFEMRYADKLFGVFQRLHSEAEFEGTGVGLAIVQRIIQRHGGRVWAEAKVGKGATFYFTVGVKNE